MPDLQKTDLPKRDLTKSNAQFQRTVNRLPLSVSSTFCSWGKDHTTCVSQGKGGHSFDIEGNAYVGHVTFAAWSQITRRSIAFAKVEAKLAPCRDIWVEIRAARDLRYAKLKLPVTEVEHPFCNPACQRATSPKRFR